MCATAKNKQFLPSLILYFCTRLLKEQENRVLLQCIYRIILLKSHMVEHFHWPYYLLLYSIVSENINAYFDYIHVHLNGVVVLLTKHIENWYLILSIIKHKNNRNSWMFWMYSGMTMAAKKEVFLISNFSLMMAWFGLWCLTPLSTIFQLYHDLQFYWCRSKNIVIALKEYYIWLLMILLTKHILRIVFSHWRKGAVVVAFAW
jgi:hypothetical protein